MTTPDDGFQQGGIVPPGSEKARLFVAHADCIFLLPEQIAYLYQLIGENPPNEDGAREGEGVTVVLKHTDPRQTKPDDTRETKPL